VKNQTLHFTLATNNFGVVRVEYAGSERPWVHYEVYGQDGGFLAEAGE
jgi:hypothetical protein